jgi:hypothetical protein
MAAQVLTDPIGVMVDLIAATDPGLDRTMIEAIVISVAGGRAKRRRLAQALLDRPALLADGRSPAPRGLGDLLIGLHQADAANISPPVCTECGKRLRTVQRRGQHWYCGVCGPRREPCAGCGKTRPVGSRDRNGGPRCADCPAQDQDPFDIIVEVVTAIDPVISAEVVVAAVRAAASRPGQRRQLAWALQDMPELLTGSGAQTPVPSVLRLIDNLCDAGATGILRPPCPHCRRVIPLVKPRDGVRLCRNCVAKSRAQPCSRCGAVREAATRDEHGRPLCPNCLISDPANLETCTNCGRRSRVSLRTPTGPLCGTCRPSKNLQCAICGRTGPCVVSETTGRPWCKACTQRWIQCAGCGEVRPLRGGTLDEPLCSSCTRPDPDFWRSCPTCGQPGRIHTGRCARCAMNRRLHELFSDDNGEIRPQLHPLYQALTTTQRPATVQRWLNNSAAPAILRNLDAGTELTHQTLDALPAGKPVQHLRSVLVAIGTLPARDEHMARLERWSAHIIAERPDPDQQQLLHRYAVWHLLRRLRNRTTGKDTTHNQAVVVQQRVKGAIALLDWLTTHGLTLATAQQGHLENWLTSQDAILRRETGHFIRWAKKQKLTSLDLPTIKWGGPSGVIDTETRWEQARWLLHDDTLKPEDRVAGLLVLLYAQWPAAISRLNLDHVQTTEHDIRLQLGREPVILPEPLATLVLELVATRRGHAAIGNQATSPWLFPGGQPARPVSPYQLGQRLRNLGLHPRRSRSAALFQLATELPAALLAHTLGIHITVAVAWQRASNGDWASYAAEVSRRPNR